MLFSAAGWTFNVRLGRSGREEGEGVIIMGEVSYRTASGERRVHPARAMVVKSDARKRLDLVLSPKETVITIPLEPFAHAASAGPAEGAGVALRHGRSHRLLRRGDRPTGSCLRRSTLPSRRRSAARSRAARRKTTVEAHATAFLILLPDMVCGSGRCRRRISAASSAGMGLPNR